MITAWHLTILEVSLNLSILCTSEASFSFQVLFAFDYICITPEKYRVFHKRGKYARCRLVLSPIFPASMQLKLISKSATFQRTFILSLYILKYFFIHFLKIMFQSKYCTISFIFSEGVISCLVSKYYLKIQFA